MSDLSERDPYARMLHGAGEIRESARGMAQSRGDMKWLILVQLMDRTIDNIKKSYTKAGAPLLILPHRTMQ